MLDKSKGKIYVAADRGHVETDWFRSYNTFNFGNFQHEHKQPFGPLHVLNDETLAGQKKLLFETEQDFCILLLPTVGAIHYSDNHGHDMLFEAGELQICCLPKGTQFEIRNPYERELVNFLQIWFKQPVDTDSKSQKVVFDLEQNKNKLVPLFSSISNKDETLGFGCYIGKFTGRSELVYKLSQPHHKMFAFVIEGAFEVQYRLLEARDGLCLWNTGEAELESLSNDAIILIIEMS